MQTITLRLLTIILLTLGAAGARGADWPDFGRSGATRPQFAAGRDSVEAVLGRMPLDALEGMWQFPSGGATVAIVTAPDSEPGQRMEMIIVEAPDRSLRPGTIVGAIDRGGERNVYRATLMTDLSDRGLLPASPRQFVLTLDKDGAFLKIEPRRKNYRLNLWRLLPMMFSRLVSTRFQGRQEIDGCTRVFPEPDPPIQPRYL